MARKQITVEVRQGDIDRAIRGNSHHCAVALALARLLPDAHHFEVDTTTIRYSEGVRRVIYITPLVVQQYVADFDAGEAVDPFRFTLRNPWETRRRVVRKEDLETKAGQMRARRKSEQMSKAGKASAAKRANVSNAPVLPTTTVRTENVPGTATRKPPPRVFRTSRRDYGHRVLRVNRGS